MKTNIIALFFIFLTSNAYSQKNVDASVYIQFLEQLPNEKLVFPVSLEMETIVLKNHMKDSIYADQLKSLLSIKSFKEIIKKINADKNTTLTKGEKTVLLSQSQIFDNLSSFTYEVPLVEHGIMYSSEEIERINRQALEAKQRAVNKQKATLEDYLHTTYTVSRLYYNKRKTYCVLFIQKNTVGDNLKKMGIYKLENQKWILMDCLLSCDK